MAKQKKHEGRVKGRRRKRENEERGEFISQLSTPELVEHMVSLGLKVSEDIALEIARREDAILNHFRMLLNDTSDQVFTTLLVSEILSFRDPSVLEEVYSAFDEDRVDTFLFGRREEVEEILNDEKQEYMMFMEKEPLDHFSSENIYHLAKMHYPEEAEQ